jgi:hypothetical protein
LNGQHLNNIIQNQRYLIIKNLYIFQSLRWYRNFEDQKKYTTVNSFRYNDFKPEDTSYYLDFRFKILEKKKFPDSCFVLVKLERLNDLVTRQYFLTRIPGYFTQGITSFTSSFDSIDRRVGLIIVDTCMSNIYYVDGPFILDNTSFLYKNIKDERERVCNYSEVRFYLQEPSMIDVDIKNKTITINTRYKGIFKFNYELDGDYIIINKILDD